MKKGLLIALTFAISAFAWSQKGSIRGKVIDANNAEELIGSTVVIAGTTNGAATDFEGNYSINNLEPGVYDLNISYISYQTKTVTGVEVKAGETTLIDVSLSSAVEELQEVVVTAEVIKDSEVAILTVKKKSANLIDGISSQSFKKMGDANAASAMKRISGVSIQGGKYVYVRGLGDRYTKSVLNGMDVPGLDPDRNTLQMDIFPTNIINNITVVKSFTADLGADFTGGIVDIETKDFPEEKTMNASVSLSYNPSMHFNNNYLSYQGGSTDFLGFDDGTRSLPISKQQGIPSTAVGDPTLTTITEKFNSTLAAQRGTSGMNYGVSFSAGNQFNREKYTIGYNTALSYKNTTTFYEGVENNIYTKPNVSEETELLTDRLQVGDIGKNNTLVSGLLGGALKTDKSKIKVNLMHIQNGESRAGVFMRENFIRSSNVSFRDNLEYTEKSITNALLAGEHVFGLDNNWQIDWKLSPTISQINDKDVRVTPFTVEDDRYSIQPSEGGDPTRIWRELFEVNYVGRLDISNKYNLFNNDAKVKFGGSYSVKQRDYEILNYRLNVRNQSTLGLTGDANELMLEENLWTAENNIGTSVEGNYEISNSYDATQTNMGVYVSNEFAPFEKLKAIIGVRMEQYAQYYTGQNQTGSEVYNNEKIINSTDLFPTANLIYSLSDNTNVRASYSKTVARPSFKEASIAQIFDAITGRTFIGNIDLEQTDINNVDLRWEMYLPKGQMVSVSGFYKAFTNPIELVAFSDAAPDNFQPRNLGDAKVYGVELELRKDLAMFSPALKHFNFNTNISLIQSALELDKSPNGEYESRMNNLRNGETLSDTRQMQGQAPYIINAGLSYLKMENGFEAGLYYNVQGKKLAVVGLGPNPDVFEQPFHSMNFSMSKELGKENQSKITFGIKNLLNDKVESYYESYGSEDKVFSSYAPGRSFNLSYSLNF